MPTYKRRETLLTLVTSYDDCPIIIDKKEYISITEGFMEFIADKILDGEDVRLPLNMGIIRIYGKKPKIEFKDNGEIKGLAPDWKKTLKLWNEDKEAKKNKKMIYHFNDHTRGIRYRFSWLTNMVSLTTKKLYVFRATRANKRAVWQRILKGKEYRIFKINKL